MPHPTHINLKTFHNQNSKTLQGAITNDDALPFTL